MTWRGGTQGAGGKNSLPGVPGVASKREIQSSFILAHVDRRQGEHLVGHVSVE